MKKITILSLISVSAGLFIFGAQVIVLAGCDEHPARNKATPSEITPTDKTKYVDIDFQIKGVNKRVKKPLQQTIRRAETNFNRIFHMLDKDLVKTVSIKGKKMGGVWIEQEKKRFSFSFAPDSDKCSVRILIYKDKIFGTELRDKRMRLVFYPEQCAIVSCNNPRDFNLDFYQKTNNLKNCEIYLKTGEKYIGEWDNSGNLKSQKILKWHSDQRSNGGQP